MGKRSPIKASNATKAPFLRGDERQAPDIDAKPPAFSFEKMQDDSGHSFNCCIDDDRLALAKRIFMLSRIPWKQIMLAPSGGLGAEKIPRYRIRAAVPRAITEDVSYFYSLHYSGKKRFIGYRISQIFHILWVDHDFTVYDHGP
jgi:hypothetical protein